MKFSVDNIIKVLKQVKIGFSVSEEQIHNAVMKEFNDNGIKFCHEYKLSEGSRIDFIVGDIGIEIKNHDININSLKKQLAKYAESDLISCLILVSAKSIKLPEYIGKKKIYTINLSRNWSIAL